MIKSFIYNNDKNLYEFIKKINSNETIKELNCFVAYSNFFSIWKIIELFKENNNNVKLNFYFSKNVSKEFIIDENYFYENSNFKFLDEIPYIILESIFSYVDFSKSKNKNIEIMAFKINSKKTITNNEKIFHGKLYEIKTNRNQYLIVGSSNLTYTGLGINNKSSTDFFCNETNIVIENDDLFLKNWKKDFNESYSTLDSINNLLDDYQTISFKDLMKYMYSKEYFIDEDFNNILDKFMKESKVKDCLVDYQKQTLIKLITAMTNFGGAVLNYDVGLGKTHVGLAIYDLFANYVNTRTKIIVPPGLKEEWKSYKNQFQHELRNIENDVLSQTSEADRIDKAEVLIIDEAHNYRNKNTKKRVELIKSFFDNDYKKADGNKFNRENKMVLLITATPFNNSEDDLQNLIDLFGERSFGDKNKYHEIDKIWNSRYEIFTKNKDIENDEKVKLFIQFFFNRLNKKSKRYEEGKKIYYFPKINLLGQKNLNPVVVEDANFVNQYGRERIKKFNDIYNEIYENVCNIARSKIFTLDAESLLKNNLLISLDSSIEAFVYSLDLIIKRVKLNISLFKRNHEWYKKQYNLIHNNSSNDFVDSDFFDDQYEPEEVIYEKSSDNYFYPVKFIERFLDANFEKKLEEIENWLNNKIKNNKEISSAIDIKYNYLIYILNKINDINKRKIIIFCSRINTVDVLCQKIVDTNLINDNDAIISANSKEIKIFFKDKSFEKINLNINDAKELVKKLFSPLCNRETNNKKINTLYEKYKKFNFKFLISTNVFAEGHNIQDATVLINFDNHYNPMVLMQRIGRVDRYRDYKNIYTDDIYKNIYVFSLWTNKKVVNEVMHKAVVNKTYLADVLGSDTHKYYISPENVQSYIDSKELQNNSQQKLLKEEITDEIATYKYKKYKDWKQAKIDIEKNNPQYLIYKNKKNGLIIILNVDNAVKILYINDNYKTFINSNEVYKNWIDNDSESIENNKVNFDSKYLEWLAKIRNDQIISNTIKKIKNINNNNIEIEKIIYLMEEN